MPPWSMSRAARCPSRSAPAPGYRRRSHQPPRTRSSMLRAISAVAWAWALDVSATLPVISFTSVITVPISVIESTDAVGGRLDLPDLRLDFGGKVRRLGRQRLDLVGDDGETAARLARPCRLDRRIQREQVGLAGDRVDRLDDFADARGDLLQHINAAGGVAHAFDGAFGYLRGTQNVGADPVCIRGKHRRRRRDRLHAGSRLFGRRANRVYAFAGG